MEEQVVVEDSVHATMLQHNLDMLVQLLADHKRMMQFLNQNFLFFR